MLLAEELLDLAGPAEPSKYAQIVAWKSDKVWKKAEKNWALGSGYSEQGEGSCVSDNAEMPKTESTSYTCMCLFAHPTQVQNFSSAKYKSHRCIPETATQAFD